MIEWLLIGFLVILLSLGMNIQRREREKRVEKLNEETMEANKIDIS